MKVTKEFTFDSAHYLPGYRGKCANLHGHTYKLHITVEGEIGKDGFVMDFGKLKKIVEKNVINKLDHKYLNDITGLEMPTAENTCKWMWDKLDYKIPRDIYLTEIKLWETPTAFATYDGWEFEC